MVRLTRLNPDYFTYLDPDDECFHIGEYTAGGGYQASDTNQQIYNLKKKPTSSSAQLKWKASAVEYWAHKITNSNLNWEFCRQNVTFVPLPCSKPEGNELYDDRMLKVLETLKKWRSGLDVRPLLRQTVEREYQHGGNRLTPDEIRAQIEVDGEQLEPAIKHVILVDDIITRGASYAAARTIVAALPGVESVMGLFLAKTVHPPIDFDAIFEDD